MMRSLALDQILLASATLLGAIAAAYSLVISVTTVDEEDPAATDRGRSGLAAGVGVVVALFLLTLLARPPFSPGGRLGIGLMVGGLTAAGTALAAARTRRAGAAAFLLAGGVSLAASAGLMLRYRGDPVDALIGLALGQAIVAVFAVPEAAGRTGRGSASLEALPLLTALYAAAVSLAIARYAEFPAAERLAVGEKLWWTLPAVILGSMLIGQIAAMALGRGSTARLLIAAVAATAALAVFAISFPRYQPLLPAVAAGYVSGALLVALASAPAGAGSALLGAGIALALLIVAYRFTAGYGIALAALGFAGTSIAWPPAPERDDDREVDAYAPPLPLAALALLAFAAFFRVFYVRYDLDTTSVFLTAHYTLIGLIVGALAPQALAAVSFTSHNGEPEADPERDQFRRATARRALVLAGAVGLPALMVLFWGIRACAGVLLGLSLGQAYLLWVRLLEGDAAGGAAARLARAGTVAPVLVLALTCVQGLSFLEEYTGLLTRTHRIAIVLLIVALFPIATLLRALAGRKTDLR